ncbi:DUF366 family protein [Bdellovibrionota bacterium FG-1]
MTLLATRFSKEERPYTGVELKPHFLLTQMNLKGSAIGAFIGPCHVQTEHLVDWEDRLAQDRIEARWMVHFIGEFFGMGLREGVFLQRLFMATLGDLVNESLHQGGRAGDGVRRDGDDLFVGDRKLSVSIVTASPVSVLLHAGINIDPTGAPVPAIGLQELGVLPEEWVPLALERFAQEYEGIVWACAKVRPVL